MTCSYFREKCSCSVETKCTLFTIHYSGSVKYLHTFWNTNYLAIYFWCFSWTTIEFVCPTSYQSELFNMIEWIIMIKKFGTSQCEISHTNHIVFAHGLGRIIFHRCSFSQLSERCLHSTVVANWDTSSLENRTYRNLFDQSVFDTEVDTEIFLIGIQKHGLHRNILHRHTAHSKHSHTHSQHARTSVTDY